MSEGKKSWLKGFLWWAITSPVTVCLFALMLWVAIQAYVFENNVEQNRAALFAFFGLWVLWLIFKSLIKFLLALAIIVTAFSAFYLHQNKGEIDCEHTGKAEQICEAPKNFEDWLKDYFE